jgi:hypothetical protein
MAPKKTPVGQINNDYKLKTFFHSHKWGKTTIKGAIQMNGHYLKLHFYMFEKSCKGNIMIWIF